MIYTLEQFKKDKLFIVEVMLKYKVYPVQEIERYLGDCKIIETNWTV